jgi:hypothetical protein
MYHSITVGAGENHRRDRKAERVAVLRLIAGGCLLGLHWQLGGRRNILIDSKWFDGETGVRTSHRNSPPVSL